MLVRGNGRRICGVQVAWFPSVDVEDLFGVFDNSAEVHGYVAGNSRVLLWDGDASVPVWSPQQDILNLSPVQERVAKCELPDAT